MAGRDLTMDEMKKPGRVLIDRRRLHEIVPLSERTVFDMEQRGEFPKRFTGLVGIGAACEHDKYNKSDAGNGEQQFISEITPH